MIEKPVKKRLKPTPDKEPELDGDLDINFCTDCGDEVTRKDYPDAERCYECEIMDARGVR